MTSFYPSELFYHSPFENAIFTGKRSEKPYNNVKIKMQNVEIAGSAF